MKFPARYSHLLFGALLSAIMVMIVSGTVVLVNSGFNHDFFARWFRGFGTAWPIAFPTVLIVAPLVRRVVARITIAD